MYLYMLKTKIYIPETLNLCLNVFEHVGTSLFLIFCQTAFERPKNQKSTFEGFRGCFWGLFDLFEQFDGKIVSWKKILFLISHISCLKNGN